MRAGHALHLARRFAGSLPPGGPRPGTAAWAEGWLLPGERALWRSMSGPDRRHSAAVARRAVAALGAPPARAVVAAALLHDVGKAQAGVRTPGRVGATLAGRRRARGRWATYLRHDELGADALRRAGSDELTVAWAREHHLPEERWSVPSGIGRVLRDADDD